MMLVMTVLSPEEESQRMKQWKPTLVSTKEGCILLAAESSDTLSGSAKPLHLPWQLLGGEDEDN
jgi:hypothetical protein